MQVRQTQAERYIVRQLLAVMIWLWAGVCAAGTAINTAGSPDGIAISGFDTVAFFTQQRAVVGKPEFSTEWAGATWRFSSAEHLALFKANPEKYALQYGGHCAWCVSEGCICGRPANGLFEVLEGRLYLFPDGNKGRANGTRNAWWTKGGGPAKRIPNSDRHWPALKARLEAQPNLTPIAGPGGGMDGIR